MNSKLNNQNVRASVAMATYNGEKYISEQIETILKFLGVNDEIVISCDPSTDKTIEIVKYYSMLDNRIKVIMNIGEHGVVPNFCNAIANCKGRYIFLCDQDDVWINDKVERVIEKFECENAWLVIHDADVVDQNK